MSVIELCFDPSGITTTAFSMGTPMVQEDTVCSHYLEFSWHLVTYCERINVILRTVLYFNISFRISREHKEISTSPHESASALACTCTLRFSFAHKSGKIFFAGKRYTDCQDTNAFI